MSTEMKRTIVVMNASGILAGVLSILFLIALFYLDDGLEDIYYLGSFFTSLVITILSFGFARVIDLLNVIHERLENNNLKRD